VKLFRLSGQRGSFVSLRMTVPLRMTAALGTASIMVWLALSTGCQGIGTEPTGTASRATLFDDLWRQFDLHYSFFELKGVNWDSLSARYRPRAVAANTDAEFGTVLGQMLAELRDVHVSITPAGGSATMRYRSPFEAQSNRADAHIVFSRYVTTSYTSASGHVRYGMATPAVGYLYLPNFTGTGWAPEVDDAIRTFGAAKNLVIDVRGNGGGDYVLAPALAGRFADRARTFGYLRRRNGPAHTDFANYEAEVVEPTGNSRFSGRVYVLADRRTFSTAEDFVLAMRPLPNVTVVGDTTAGASGGPIVRELANGWTYQLSEWIEYTTTFATFEDSGLAPDVVVQAKAGDSGSGIDRALERALVLASAR
jgi:hypothetical protein